jgi:hypothetical protein
MANLQYSSDLIEHVLFEGGQKTDGTSDFDAQVLIWLNANYKKIWQGGSEFDPAINEDWTWLREKGNIILQTKITTGTVSVTNNSATATLSANQATDMDDWFFKVDNYEGIFRVSAHTAASDTLTLDSVYTGDTDTSASYMLVKLDYTLASDAIEILTPMITAHRANRWVGDNGKIHGVPLQSLPDPYELRAGIPYYFSQINETTVRFDRYADDDLIRVDYRYKKRPADLTDSGSEEPLVPRHHRHVLANMTLFDLLKAMNDDRADTVALIAKQGLKAMSVENQKRLSQMDGNYGKIHSRNDNYSRGRVYVGEPYS